MAFGTLMHSALAAKLPLERSMFTAHLACDGNSLLSPNHNRPLHLHSRIFALSATARPEPPQTAQAQLHHQPVKK